MNPLPPAAALTSAAPLAVDRRDFLRRTVSFATVATAATLPPLLGAFATPAAETPAASASPSASPSGSTPLPWQIGCYTRPWDEHDLLTALDGIAEAGFTWAGIMTAKGKSWVVVTPATAPDEAARLGDEARQRHLKILSVYGGDFPTTSVADGLTGLRRLIDCCAACGSPHLLLGGIGDDKLFETYYRIIAEACPHAADRHVTLSIKPHGGLNATSPQCRRAIERVGHPAFRLWYDPGNIFYYSDGRLDPVDDAPLAAGLVCGMSVKDFLPPKEVLVTPGTGKVRFPEVFARLRAGGFTGGPLLVECTARGSVKSITAAARQARLFLEQLVAAPA